MAQWRLVQCCFFHCCLLHDMAQVGRIEDNEGVEGVSAGYLYDEMALQSEKFLHLTGLNPIA